jgi:hypothetical protein
MEQAHVLLKTTQHAINAGRGRQAVSPKDRTQCARALSLRGRSGVSMYGRERRIERCRKDAHVTHIVWVVLDHAVRKDEVDQRSMLPWAPMLRWQLPGFFKAVPADKHAQMRSDALRGRLGVGEELANGCGMR